MSLHYSIFHVHDDPYAKQFNDFVVFCSLETLPLPVGLLESDVVYVLRNPNGTIRCRFNSQRGCQEMPNLVP